MLPGNNLTGGVWYDQARQVLEAAYRDNLDNEMTRDFRRRYLRAFSSDVYRAPRMHYIEDYFKFKSRDERQNFFHRTIRWQRYAYQFKRHFLFTIRRLTLMLFMLSPPTRNIWNYTRRLPFEDDPIRFFSDTLTRWHVLLGIDEVSSFAELVETATAARQNRLSEWQPFFRLSQRECHISYAMLIHSMDCLVRQFGFNQDHTMNWWMMILASRFPLDKLLGVLREFQVPFLSLTYDKAKMDSMRKPPGLVYVRNRDLGLDSDADSDDSLVAQVGGREDSDSETDTMPVPVILIGTR